MTIGASGAIAALIGAYLVLFPRVGIWTLMLFVIPMKIPAWIWAAIFVAIQLAGHHRHVGASARVSRPLPIWPAWRSGPRRSGSRPGTARPRDGAANVPPADGALMGFPRRAARQRRRPPGVAVAVAIHEPEADLLVQILRDAGIPAMQRRTSSTTLACLQPGHGPSWSRPASRWRHTRILDPLPGRTERR